MSEQSTEQPTGDSQGDGNTGSETPATEVNVEGDAVVNNAPDGGGVDNNGDNTGEANSGSGEANTE